MRSPNVFDSAEHRDDIFVKPLGKTWGIRASQKGKSCLIIATVFLGELEKSKKLGKDGDGEVPALKLKFRSKTPSAVILCHVYRQVRLSHVFVRWILASGICQMLGLEPFQEEPYRDLALKMYQCLDMKILQ